MGVFFVYPHAHQKVEIISQRKLNPLSRKGSARRSLMLTMPYILRNKRIVTYRRHGIPAVILEGKWLTALYRLHIGDVVDIDHQKKEIRLTKNAPLSKERQKKLKEREELRQQRIKELRNEHDQSNTNENLGARSAETGQG